MILPVESRMKELARRFDVSGSVKDLIESFGVPHTEVDLVLVNSEPADFTCLVRDQDRVSVYPVFESLDISPVPRVRPAPLRELRFVLDVHLGRLAAYLRMAGFDALYRNDASDTELAGISASERRVLLTRDRYLLMRTEVNWGYWVRSTDPRQQVVEVLKRFDLAGSMRPFTRCMKCNGPLEATSVEPVLNRLPPGAARKGGIAACIATTGWSTSNPPWATPRRCCVISAATPTAWRFPITVWCPSTASASPSAGKTTPTAPSRK